MLRRILLCGRYRERNVRNYLAQRFFYDISTVNKHHIPADSTEEKRRTNFLLLCPINSRWCHAFSENDYNTVADETLESLTEFFESLPETVTCHPDYDVTFSQGVLTVSLGDSRTYVINKQSPNRQIWLSSPFSGPKRYDFVKNRWIYFRDREALHDLLRDELRDVFQDSASIDISKCAFS